MQTGTMADERRCGGNTAGSVRPTGLLPEQLLRAFVGEAGKTLEPEQTNGANGQAHCGGKRPMTVGLHSLLKSDSRFESGPRLTPPVTSRDAPAGDQPSSCIVIRRCADTRERTRLNPKA